MKIDTITNLIMDIPMLLCRNMNKQFVNTTLVEFESGFSQHHFMVLKLLNDNEILYVTEIVEKLSITKSQMTATIDKLIQLEYVKRKNDDNDRRKVLLVITQKGVIITDKIIESLNARISKNIKQLTTEESKKLEEGINLLFKFCEIYK